MYKTLMLVLALLMAPTLTFGAHKHFEKVHAKISEHGHKKRMKKAAKQDPGAAKKHSLLHHHG